MEKVEGNTADFFFLLSMSNINGNVKRGIVEEEKDLT